MNSLKSVSPRTQLASYVPGQEINFEIHDVEGALKANSVFLTGKLTIDGAAAGTEQYYDVQTGVASFMENMVVSCGLFQEVITNYPRLVKITNSATLSADSQCVGLKNTNELLLPHINMCPTVMLNTPLGFCHKPKFALNNMSGDLDFVRSGKITVSFKLPSAGKCFFGAASAALNYSFSELELHYMQVPQGSPSVSVELVEDIVKQIQTTNTTIFNVFQNPTDKVLVAFAPVSVEADAVNNAVMCYNPSISKMSWQYNDMSNSLVSYEIETIEEQVLSGYSVFDSMNVGFDLKERLALLASDPQHSISDKFIVGLKIGEYADFSRSGLGLNVRLDSLPEQLYAYFYGLGARTLF